MKRSTPPLERHAQHQVEIRPSTTRHHALYYCLECGVNVAWLSKQQLERARKLGLVNDNPPLFD